MPKFVGPGLRAYRQQRPLDEAELWLSTYLDKVRGTLPGQVDAFKDLVAGNPNISPGLAVGMVKAGIITRDPLTGAVNPIAQKLLDMDTEARVSDLAATTPRSAGDTTNPLLAPVATDPTAPPV